MRRLDDWADAHHFAIGDAAWLHLAEKDFRAATLTTVDGNDYFVITIELQSGSIAIGDDAIFGSE